MLYDQLIHDVKQLKESKRFVYIYGAGFYGQDIFRVLQRNGIDIDGFLVTESAEKKSIFDKPIFIAREKMDEDIGIVLGLSDIYAEEVSEYLRSNGVKTTDIVNGGIYITKSGGRENLRKAPVLEITPVLGCSVNCRFCPQEVIVREYFKNDKNRKREMTMKDFAIYMNHTSCDCDIMFAGMAEPFLNPHCVEMVKMACEAGRKVSLYTTLVGATKTDVGKILELPIYYVTLHVADKFGYAHIPLTEDYYQNVERLILARKEDGKPFVDFVNCQAEPDERVAEICRGRVEVMSSVQDRAGNLEDPNLQRREKDLRPDEKIMCSFCGPRLTNNVVLPDGTVLICNMDYGMKHVLGNLLENDLETIRNSGELDRILKGMNGDSKIDVLCRKCLLARRA